MNKDLKKLVDTEIIKFKQKVLNKINDKQFKNIEIDIRIDKIKNKYYYYSKELSYAIRKLKDLKEQ